jgi:tetratricopeptide (TPR) repeat protein
MSVSRNHLTKEELRHDGFVEWTGSATAWLQKHFLTAIAGIAVLAVLVLVSVYFAQSRTRGHQESSQMLYRAGSLYGKGSYSESLVALDELIARHGGTAEGKTAHHLRGACHLALGENDAAIDEFQRYLDLDSSGAFAASARSGMALALEARGDYPRAAEEFRKLRSDLGPDDARYAQAAFGEARALAQMGQPSAAIEVLQPLVRGSDMSARQEAQSRIAVYRAKLATPSS